MYTIYEGSIDVSREGIRQGTCPPGILNLFSQVLFITRQFSRHRII
jgi:hypothetical protein